eukprot:104118-Chlamydomonas_euryale.AAC.2
MGFAPRVVAYIQGRVRAGEGGERGQATSQTASGGSTHHQLLSFLHLAVVEVGYERVDPV